MSHHLCQRCGARFPATARFCADCGAARQTGENSALADDGRIIFPAPDLPRNGDLTDVRFSRLSWLDRGKCKACLRQADPDEMIFYVYRQVFLMGGLNPKIDIRNRRPEPEWLNLEYTQKHSADSGDAVRLFWGALTSRAFAMPLVEVERVWVRPCPHCNARDSFGLIEMAQPHQRFVMVRNAQR